MLHDNFFRITKQDHQPGVITATLSVKKDHEIFSGHFPGQPVVPGVCMMQMVKEVLENYLDKSLRLTGADNMKFLSVLDPNHVHDVETSIAYNISDENISINASLFSGSTIFFKLKAALEVV